MILYPRLDEAIVIRKEKLSFLHTKQSLLNDPTPLSPLTIEPHRKIEDIENHAFVDFANHFIGGDSLGGAAVQEEILFAIFPEACISMGLCSVMHDDDAISIDGLVRSASYTGYGSSFKYDEPFITYMSYQFN